MSTRVLKFAMLAAAFFAIPPCFSADVNLYITRHGKTMFNTVERTQGWSDTPLTAPGVEVARKVGKGLEGKEFISVWSSDSGRARETARLIMENWKEQLPLNERVGLREVCFGSFEGERNHVMRTAFAKELGFADMNVAMEAYQSGKSTMKDIIDGIHRADKTGGAETFQQVSDRMTNTITEIARRAQKQGGGNVLIVSHGMAIITLLDSLNPQKPNRQMLDNASISKVRYTDEGKFIIESVNDMSWAQKGNL